MNREACSKLLSLEPMDSFWARTMSEEAFEEEALVEVEKRILESLRFLLFCKFPLLATWQAYGFSGSDTKWIYKSIPSTSSRLSL